MGKLYDEIDAKLAAWIGRQRLFFVATAPSGGGHVNVSPKGPIGTLSVVDGRTIEYVDHVGSGAETAAHLRENGRICVMSARSRARPASSGSTAAARCSSAADPGDGVRGVVRIHVERIADSCGYGVPLIEYVGERTQRDAGAPQGSRRPSQIRAGTQRRVDRRTPRVHLARLPRWTSS